MSNTSAFPHAPSVRCPDCGSPTIPFAEDPDKGPVTFTCANDKNHHVTIMPGADYRIGIDHAVDEPIGYGFGEYIYGRRIMDRLTDQQRMWGRIPPTGQVIAEGTSDDPAILRGPEMQVAWNDEVEPITTGSQAWLDAAIARMQAQIDQRIQADMEIPNEVLEGDGPRRNILDALMQSPFIRRLRGGDDDEEGT